MAWLAAAATGLQVGQSLFNASRAKRKEKRRRERRMSFFNNELNPLLEDAQIDTDLDYNSIRSAELEMPLNQMQNQMRQIGQNRDSVMGRSGFQANSFVDKNVQNDLNMVNASFDNQAYGVDKSILDMQAQLESMASQNKIQAKQLEYEYKYG